MKKLVIIQPILPFYRIAFFNILSRLLNHLVLYHSPSFSDFKSLESSDTITFDRHVLPPLLHFPFNLRWQSGLLDIPLDHHTVVCICGAPRDFSTLLFIVRCIILRVPIIWWGHYRSSSTSLPGLLIRVLLMRISSSVLFYTNKEVTRYLDSHPRFLLNKRVSGIDNGANVELVDKYSTPYIFHDRSHSILFIGRNSPKARFSLLLDALSLIHHVSFNLHIIGFDDFPHSPSLENHNLIFHGSLTDEKQISDIVNKCFILFIQVL